MSNVIDLFKATLRIRVRREIAEFANSSQLQNTALGLKLAQMVEQMDIANR